MWEEAIINCPRHIQILAMSATVQNPEELGGWINEVCVCVVVGGGFCVRVEAAFVIGWGLRGISLSWVFS